MKDDIEARLRHCSENTKDEYLHEQAGRPDDTIASLRAEVERLREALDWALPYAENSTTDDDGLEAARAALGDSHG